MSGWLPVKSVKGGKGTSFGSIDKTGRLLIPLLVSSARDLKPGCYLELYTQKVNDTLLLGLKPVPAETAYSVRTSCTGKLEDFGKKGKDGHIANLTCSVRVALNTHGYSIIRRIRVGLHWDEAEGMLIVTVGASVSTEADIVEPK